MKVVLDHTHQENHNVRTFWFKPPHKVRYTAGQFIEITLPHANPDERGIRHWFTLSSSPSEPGLSITTKYAGESGSSLKRKLFSIKPGTEIHMSDPMGDFVLPKDQNIPLVFVAGGIGVTPFISIIKWLIDSGEKRKLQVILAAHTQNDLIFVNLFKKYGVGPILAIDVGTEPSLTAKFILGCVEPLNNKLLYISGPEPMVEALSDDLEKHGVPKEQLVGDFFPGYTII